MIDVHYWPTPNGWKVTILLEECGLPYNIIPVDIGGGAQFTPEFLRLSPNNRMPAIVDHEPMGGGEPLALFESGAIMEYIADKTGKFLASSGPDRYRTLQWVHWQMANLGPMMGNANHFKNYGKNIADDPAQLEYGTQRFVGEVDRLLGVLDAQLSVHEYVSGGDYTYCRHDHLVVGIFRSSAGWARTPVWKSVPECEALGRSGGRPACGADKVASRVMEEIGKAERKLSED